MSWPLESVNTCVTQLIYLQVNESVLSNVLNIVISQRNDLQMFVDVSLQMEMILDSVTH